MKYMCIVIANDDLANRMTPDDWAEMDRDSQAYDKSLMDRGVYVAAEALVGRDAARNVKIRNGEALVTDGPYMETKEIIAGFIIVDVANADEAMEIARSIPMARLGGIEVRPLMQWD